MIAALFAFTLIYLKANVLGQGFKWMFAAAVPLVVLIVLATTLIYLRYLVKIQLSDPGLFGFLTASLVITALGFTSFVICLSIYFDSQDKSYAYFALCPYYVALTILIAYYVYMVPGVFAKSPSV